MVGVPEPSVDMGTLIVPPPIMRGGAVVMQIDVDGNTPPTNTVEPRNGVETFWARVINSGSGNCVRLTFDLQRQGI